MVNERTCLLCRIFILEGCATVLVAMIAYFIIVPFPEDCNFLSPEEKRILLARLEADGANVANDKVDFWNTVSDWKIWVAIIIYMGAEENSSSVVAFQPTVLNGLGYTASAAQVHSIPIYAVAWVFAMTSAYLSDRFRQRYIFALFGTALMTIGLAIEIAQPKASGARYTGMFFLASGTYIVMPITVVWLAINVGKGYKRTIALGLAIPIGNCGAFISSNVFLTKETPKFHTGFSVGMAMCMMCLVALTVMYVGLRLENRRRDRKEMESPLMDEEVLQDLGDQHPSFRYAL